jgi:hypothetical protein
MSNVNTMSQSEFMHGERKTKGETLIFLSSRSCAFGYIEQWIGGKESIENY